MVELATMPDLPTRVHLDSLCSIAGCVESYSRTHTVPGVGAGSSLASGWGGTSSGSMVQDWSQAPPGLSQTTGACWDCARGLCLRLDHGSTGLALKVSNTPAHSTASGDQGNAPVYQGAGVTQGTSAVTQGSLLDLSTHSRLPAFTDVPPAHALYVPSRYPGEAQSYSDVTPDVSVTSQVSRPPSPMDTQTTSEVVSLTGPVTSLTL